MHEKENEIQVVSDIVGSFIDYLKNTGLKESTIKKHADYLDLFLDPYLSMYEISLNEFDAEMIVDFLGNFYIRKFLFSKKSDIPPFLSMFKKFAAFCLHRECINESTYRDIIEICKKKDFFYHRFDTYMETDNFMEWDFENDVEQYEEEREEEKESYRNNPLPRNEKLLAQLRNHNIETARIVPVFRFVMQEIASCSQVKLTAGRSHLTRAFWYEADQKFQLNQFKKTSLNQEDIPLYHFMYHVLVQTGAIQIEGQKAIATPRLREIGALSDVELLALLLDYLWSHIDWEDLQRGNIGGRTEVSQASRADYARVLASFPVDKEVTRSNGMNQLITHIFNGTFDVFFLSILPVLEYMDMVRLSFIHDENQKSYHYSYELHGIQVTDRGKTLFTYWQRNDKPRLSRDKMDRMDPLSALLVSLRNPEAKEPVTIEKVGRNEPCPCGSGQKYKKCCGK